MSSLIERTALGPAQALIVAGADAEAFLQAQMASDVSAVQLDMWQWSAWLDARGRVRCLGQLARCGSQDWLMFLRGGEAREICAALQRYVFRLRVALRVLDGWQRVTGGPLPMHALATGDDNTFAFGLDDRSIILSAEPAKPDPSRAAAFALADIRAGFPILAQRSLDQLLPPALGLYRLGAVATSKGCYPGQEIVSRLYHLGGHKRHLRRVAIDRQQSNGDIIESAGRSVGMLLNSAGTEALAILRDDALGAPGVPAVLESFPP